MSGVYKHVLTYVMMLVLFTTSTGFTMFTHMCFMEGKKEISATAIDACCSSEETPATQQLNNNCCNEESYFYKLDYLASLHRAGESDIFLPVSFLLQEFISPEIQVYTLDLTSTQPPPKSGREILTAIRILQV